MFSRLFCGMFFITAVLGNVVMAYENRINDKLYDVLNYVFKCNDVNRYSDECLTRTIDKLQSKPIQDIYDEISGIYKEYTGEFISIDDWVITLTAYAQDRRNKNKEYNRHNGIFSEYVATQYSTLAIINKNSVKSDVLCQNLIYHAAMNDNALTEMLKTRTLSEEKEEELTKIALNLTSGCTVKHDKFSNLKFPVRWNDNQLSEYIGDYYEILIEIDQGL